MQEVAFVEFSIDYLNLSGLWLKDPEIKKLTNSPELTRVTQISWFETLKFRSDYKIWGIEYDNKKIGVVGLKNISSPCAEYFGYIGEKEYWNKGISKYMLDHTCLYAKTNNIKEIHLRVIKDNPRAIRAYEKYGFEVYDDKNNEYLMRLNIL